MGLHTVTGANTAVQGTHSGGTLHTERCVENVGKTSTSRLYAGANRGNS